jgi:hypothetical protein
MIANYDATTSNNRYKKRIKFDPNPYPFILLFCGGYHDTYFFCFLTRDIANRVGHSAYNDFAQTVE